MTDFRQVVEEARMYHEVSSVYHWKKIFLLKSLVVNPEALYDEEGGEAH